MLPWEALSFNEGGGFPYSFITISLSLRDAATFSQTAVERSIIFFIRLSYPIDRL